MSQGGDMGRRKGHCKWFNVAKGWGFVSPEDGSQDVFVHQSVIQMSGFRSLGEEEEVEFECRPSDKGLEATVVTGLEGLECKGSHRRPLSKKRFRKIRCYNCGEFANHVAAKCTQGPMPKRCHQCKSDGHLIADCPQRPEKPIKNLSESDDEKNTENVEEETNKGEVGQEKNEESNLKKGVVETEKDKGEIKTEEEEEKAEKEEAKAEKEEAKAEKEEVKAEEVEENAEKEKMKAAESPERE